MVVFGSDFFCKCADSTSHYMAKQLQGLGKPIWPSSKFDSRNNDYEQKDDLGEGGEKKGGERQKQNRVDIFEYRILFI